MRRGSLAVLLLLAACTPRPEHPGHAESRFFEILRNPVSGAFSAVSKSPFDGQADTLDLATPLRRLVVMSTSHVGFLDALGCDSVIVGVSGLDFVTAPEVRDRAARGQVAEVGYGAGLDYERIVALHPDLLVAYTVSAVRPPFLAKLESLGVRVFLVHEHLEADPLGRASYLRLFGAMTGRLDRADSLFARIETRYRALQSRLPADARRRKVLLNIPYKDQWFVPGGESYVSKLIRDAGGVVLGAVPGQGRSGVISLERAFALSDSADCWLNPGWCRTLSQLQGENPLFPAMLDRIRDNARRAGSDPEAVVWNDNLRLNGKGGNDFWESGVTHPDLVLEDLLRILHPECLPPREPEAAPFRYYRKVE